jgi:soluble lytic murein transglycosylase-like protein
MIGRTSATLAMAALLIAGAARAQVYEVQPDGSVITFGGPTQFNADGARPLVPPPPLPGHPAAVARARSTGRAAPRASTPPQGVAAVIHEASARHQVDEHLVEAVAWRESGFNPAAVSPKGARGVMQLMPGTARAMGVDAADPISNIDGGADYLSRMLRLFNGDKTLALAAYNAGPEAVARYGGVPPYAETIGYVRSVMGRMNQTAQATAPSEPRLP